MRAGPIGLSLLAATAVAPGCGSDESAIALGFPVLERERIGDLYGFDHDPADHGDGLGRGICTNFRGRGFPSCYDGHQGSDYLLAGGFEAMDSGSARVVAAQSGVVVEVHDGEYDRCHREGTGISCDGYPMIGNSVVIEHSPDVRTRYWHFMRDSLEVEVGQEVSCGTVLGKIGSSGISAAPHLHFELVIDGEAVDPYSGEHSQEQSYWQEQWSREDPWPAAGCAGRDP